MILPVNPFDSDRFIGTITQIGPSSARVNLPYAAAPSPRLYHGKSIGAGEVGEFVVVESGSAAILGRILEVRLPERERLGVETELGEEHEVHPIGTIQLLATIEVDKGSISPGILNYPRLGNAVYSAQSELIQWLIESSGKKENINSKVILNIAELPRTEKTPVSMTPEKLFGRHCAILGSTGGGKSWTLARLLEEIVNYRSKAILLDATGEFYRFKENTLHVYVGEDQNPTTGSLEVVFPYSDLTESDLFAIFSPSGQAQVPKLRNAMKSLKLLRLEPSLGINGIIKKENRSFAAYNEAWRKHAKKVEDNTAEFDIKYLSRQIDAECVWPPSNANPNLWGRVNEQDRAYCVGLINRVEDIISSKGLACVFNTQDKPSLKNIIETFLGDNSHCLLRMSLKYLPFEYNAREIVANAIGRFLLQLGRSDKFKNKPVVIFLDEAHQFLNRTIGDEHSKYPLDSFSLIAKEGRKYCLNICISTQRPRDIPEDVLSQMGTLVVHRLITDRDREVVERASGDIDRSAAAFLPTLGPGEAIVIGVDFPIPLSLKIQPPRFEPDSQGPKYQTCWSEEPKIC